MNVVDYTCLVACTSRKAAQPTKAELLYKSPLFFGARQYAQERCSRWFILSAKHGLVLPDQHLAPYDEALHGLKPAERQAWANRVLNRFLPLVPTSSHVVFLAGDPYRDPLSDLLGQAGYQASAPLSALGIGSQVAWLQRLERERSRIAHLDRFYGLLERLRVLRGAKPCTLSSYSVRDVASRGIYFFFERSESRMLSPAQARVVRIGTHSVSQGSKATLWGRLRTHRGADGGKGNHRGSIFRLHVGEALLRRSDIASDFSSWGIGQSARQTIRMAEEEIELQVSEIIGAMSMLCLEVADASSADSDRSYLERNLIALVAGANGPIDLPSSDWLGHHSSRSAVRDSGLWNVNYVYDDYDSQVLDILEEYVRAAEGSRAKITKSLAPSGWRQTMRTNVTRTKQMPLL